MVTLDKAQHLLIPLPAIQPTASSWVHGQWLILAHTSFLVERHVF